MLEILIPRSLRLLGHNADPGAAADTVDVSEIRDSPVEVGSTYPINLQGFLYTSQVVQ